MLSTIMLYSVVKSYICMYLSARCVQDAIDAPADWPEKALKGKCCFIVNVSEAAEPCFMVAKDEADKR